MSGILKTRIFNRMQQWGAKEGLILINFANMTGFFYGVWPFKTYSIGIACNLQKKAQKIINSEFMINYNPQDMKNWRLRLCQQDYDQRQLYKYFSGSLVSCLFLLDCAERSILNWLKGSYLKTFFFFFRILWSVTSIIYIICSPSPYQ